jgi:hypothetical protein
MNSTLNLKDMKEGDAFPMREVDGEETAGRVATVSTDKRGTTYVEVDEGDIFNRGDRLLFKQTKSGKQYLHFDGEGWLALKVTDGRVDWDC